MAREIEQVRKSEHRTRSELVREALRKYIRDAAVATLRERAAGLPEDEPMADELEAVREGGREFRTGRHQPFARLRHGLHGTRQPSRAKKP